MGYTTDFSGSFTLNKQLDSETHTRLSNFNLMRHMKRSVRGYGVEGEFYVPVVKDEMETNASAETIVDSHRPPSTQPGLWCQWRPSDSGLEIEWDGGEKFYNYAEWLKYIVTNFLAPKGYSISGTVQFQGENQDDFGAIIVKNNEISVTKGTLRKDYGPPRKV